MKKVRPLLLASFAALSVLCSCRNTTPTAGDMDRYYREADAHAERQIAYYGKLRDKGELTPDEYDQKVAAVNDMVGKHAMEMAWSKHEMAESVKRSLSIPTGGNPVAITPPGIGSSDSFYRAAGQNGGGGYQGTGVGPTHGYSPGSNVDALTNMLAR